MSFNHLEPVRDPDRLLTEISDVSGTRSMPDIAHALLTSGMLNPFAFIKTSLGHTRLSLYVAAEGGLSGRSLKHDIRNWAAGETLDVGDWERAWKDHRGVSSPSIVLRSVWSDGTYASPIDFTGRPVSHPTSRPASRFAVGRVGQGTVYSNSDDALFSRIGMWINRPSWVNAKRVGIQSISHRVHAQQIALADPQIDRDLRSYRVAQSPGIDAHATLNRLRIAGLAALTFGDDSEDPVITAELWDWSGKVVALSRRNRDNTIRVAA